MVAWPVPESDAFPVGITYRFQYMDAAGDTPFESLIHNSHSTNIGNWRPDWPFPHGTGERMQSYTIVDLANKTTWKKYAETDN